MRFNRFNPEDKVIHKAYPKKVGTIVKKVPGSDFYYVRMSWTLWSMHEDSLKPVESKMKFLPDQTQCLS